MLAIDNLNLPRMMDTITVLVEAPDSVQGPFATQAYLENVTLPPADYPDSTKLPSDNPLTIAEYDATGFVVLPFDKSQFAGGDFVLCKGDEISVPADPFPTGYQVKWDNGSIEKQLRVNQPGQFVATVEDACDHSFSAKFNVSESSATVEIPVPSQSLGEAWPIEPAISSTSPVVAIHWQATDSLSCLDCFKPELLLSKPFFIHCLVENEDGCIGLDSLNLSPTIKVYLPNVFSPNFDGENDFVSISGNGNYKIRAMKIFDRWGNLVFSKNNLPINTESDGWDGRFRGKVLGEGVYTCLFEIEY